jgi:dihydrofolate synthase / folylpolyglutamate synthase
MQIKTLPQFEAYLKTRIPTREALFVGDLGLQRAKYFMRLLGNPQNKTRVIHIAGTSGKGSTAYLTSRLLQSQGFRVGLSISPHVFDIRERIQIDNQLPTKKMILKYFNQLLPAIKKMEKCSYGAPTYFEILVGLAYHIFAKEKLDYAVMETGLGGRLDGTNTVTNKNKICLITKIGLDHTEILGNTVAKIASEKSGIIQNKNTVISSQSSITSNRIIAAKCQEKNATLYPIVPWKNYRLISATQTETTFDFSFNLNKKNRIYQNPTTAFFWYKFKKIELSLIGAHQIENCSLVLACLSILSERDKFTINESAMRSALKKIKIPGRMEIRKIGKTSLVIDGAHSPQKMGALIGSLEKIFPSQKFDFILAFKKGKDFKEMLRKILPTANHIFLTGFSTTNQDDYWNSIDNAQIETFLRKEKFIRFSIIQNNGKEILLTVKKSKKPVVLTGSLYLISSVYKHFKK